MKLTTEERTHLNNSFMLSFSDGPAKTILALDDAAGPQSHPAGSRSTRHGHTSMAASL
ncbi:hypothetical protein JCM18918_1331 [Cutibacterium acnes JCM 18918]|nr:hypothetical protein JCM18918_1331 [Cutibacterium acnes JCM 18918]